MAKKTTTNQSILLTGFLLLIIMMPLPIASNDNKINEIVMIPIAINYAVSLFGLFPNAFSYASLSVTGLGINSSCLLYTNCFL